MVTDQVNDAIKNTLENQIRGQLEYMVNEKIDIAFAPRDRQIQGALKAVSELESRFKQTEDRQEQDEKADRMDTLIFLRFSVSER